MNFYLEKMIELGADGVDFHKFAINSKPPFDVIVSYSKQEFESGQVTNIPKAPYHFWINNGGYKEYLFPEKQTDKTIQTIEILGNDELEQAFNDLGIIANHTYCGKYCCVWEISKLDFDKLCNIPDNKWKVNWGWWRYAEGSVIRNYPTKAFTVNNSTMIGYYDSDRLNDYIEFWAEDDETTKEEAKQDYFSRSYDGLRSYLCDVIGASTESNVCAVAKDIARLNGLTLGELFCKYGDKQG